MQSSPEVSGFTAHRCAAECDLDTITRKLQPHQCLACFCLILLGTLDTTEVQVTLIHDDCLPFQFHQNWELGIRTTHHLRINDQHVRLFNILNEVLDVLCDNFLSLPHRVVMSRNTHCYMGI